MRVDDTSSRAHDARRTRQSRVRAQPHHSVIFYITWRLRISVIPFPLHCVLALYSVVLSLIMYTSLKGMMKSLAPTYVMLPPLRRGTRRVSRLFWNSKKNVHFPKSSYIVGDIKLNDVVQF
ncbi:hypothetical protein EVAR_98340_1 [Eumeta japonica]|uniref:Uncharacterized protein n=1 Tax=Eumeta variegata TaxID=151549 RepID=A0A4C1XBT7_EUMVA|nr:hypothetical protein EVAR_98340_1 [Eumeta japonica]